MMKVGKGVYIGEDKRGDKRMEKMVGKSGKGKGGKEMNFSNFGSGNRLNKFNTNCS